MKFESTLCDGQGNMRVPYEDATYFLAGEGGGPMRPCPGCGACRGPFDPAYIPLLIEECAEVQKAATKMVRFGIDHQYRKGEHQGRTNLEALTEEVGQLMQVVSELGLDHDLLELARARKREALQMYGPHTWYPGIEDDHTPDESPEGKGADFVSRGGADVDSIQEVVNMVIRRNSLDHEVDVFAESLTKSTPYNLGVVANRLYELAVHNAYTREGVNLRATLLKISDALGELGDAAAKAEQAQDEGNQS